MCARRPANESVPFSSAPTSTPPMKPVTERVNRAVPAAIVVAPDSGDRLSGRVPRRAPPACPSVPPHAASARAARHERGREAHEAHSAGHR